MKKNLFLLTCAVSFLLTGCYNTPMIPEEILQIPKHTAVYTAHNIWYKDPMDIPAENIQEGKILRFGTKVKITELNRKSVTFIADGKEFRMSIREEDTLTHPEDYVRTIFTTKNGLELTAGIKPVIYEKMCRGVVAVGMTRNEVLITCGPPAATRTPSVESATWVYWTGRVKSKRIVFAKDRVSTIFELE